MIHRNGLATILKCEGNSDAGQTFATIQSPRLLQFAAGTTANAIKVLLRDHPGWTERSGGLNSDRLFGRTVAAADPGAADPLVADLLFAGVCCVRHGDLAHLARRCGIYR
ncbi:hypothetical protein [Bradyrhizobium iriomotense]|uniref:hypothetical protein n=1 Tax=Bradyrhizobium iriomotense TaxID=441950 RepID=UPI001B89F3B5|nr:hypothetical protein [Bradyrhizobium iriomotense]MBR1132780.1 hypothetical protein [Bradyrhizobium iriomotense]